jgi:hypothetical protein
MYFKIKTSRKTVLESGKEKTIIETYFTDALHFADAGYKVIQEIGTDAEVEDVCMMKNYKPAVNDKFSEDNKLFIVKVAEDQLQEDGTYKTIKYILPAFANDSNQLQQIMKNYIAQGLENMRLTTISETKWIYLQ